MEKVISIRADEAVHKDLKVLAALKEMSVGDLLEALVRDEMSRMSRGRRIGGEIAPENGQSGQSNNKGERRQKKKKRGF